jgi:hypothetical protein
MLGTFKIVNQHDIIETMKTVACYHRSVPNAKNQEKINTLLYFSQGINTTGDKAINVQDYKYVPADVGIIQGWLGYNAGLSVHLNLRRTVIKNQINQNKYVITADSNLFLYANTSNHPHHYLRYSFNGVFPNTGIYCDTDIDPQRWRQISKDLNISLKDYRTTGDHILLCLQRNGGWSMGAVNIQDWAIETIKKIRQYTDRPIVVRPHPGDKHSKAILTPDNPQCRILLSLNVRISTNESLLDDLKNCWAAVNYNSSPVVGAAIEGIPIFVSDKSKSQCAEISNNLENIETPILFDRQQWAERISMFHWKFSELKDGSCWQHMKQFIPNVS